MTDRPRPFSSAKPFQTPAESNSSQRRSTPRAGDETHAILPSQSINTTCDDPTRSNIPNPPFLSSPGITNLGGPGHQRQPAQYHHHLAVQSQYGVGVGLGINTYGQTPSPGPLMWDWDNSTAGFGDFAHFYEPQGELVVEELHNQRSSQPDFTLSQYLGPGAAPFQSIPPQVGESSRRSTPPKNAAANASEPTSRSHPPPTSPAPEPSLHAQPPAPPQATSPRPPPRPAIQTGMKRKAVSEPSSANSQTAPAAAKPLFPPSKRSATSRTASGATERRSSAGQYGVEVDWSPVNTGAGASGEGEARQEEAVAAARKTSTERGTANANGDHSVEKSVPNVRVRQIPDVPSISSVLPAGKVFPIQIGSKLFRLSGASISSDSPSYFSHFFGQQLLSADGRSGNIHTLYIDRDPNTFRDISMHLQGYHIKPRDGLHYVRLYADAQFYSLPRLTQQLFKSEIFVRVGDRDFQIPRELFSGPGNTPNFFSLGFAHFLGTPSDTFPGLDRQTLLRPPSILPPAVPNRSAEIFADLLRLLKGYPVNVRDDAHREDLLRDARYFNLKGVEQRLLPCEIGYNLARSESEITIRLEDVRQSGVSFTPARLADLGWGVESRINPATVPDTPPSASGAPAPGAGIPPHRGHICYARPYTDEASSALIVEIGSPEATRLDLTSMRATFYGLTKSRISSLFQVIAAKMNLPLMHLPLGIMMMKGRAEREREGAPTPKPVAEGLSALPVSPANSGVSGDRVRVRFDTDSAVTLDGGLIEWEAVGDMTSQPPNLLPRIRRWSVNRHDRVLDVTKQWIVKRALWRVLVEPAEDEPDNGKVEVVMVCVKMVAFTDQWARNSKRRFLSS
ncbi:hypothetical protein P152DRAFT_450212 [Eremomyces bilateralis CBS 781.70]|uniref:BTB/POZ domain-containing protein n=1 Tax=Eremomyces bilateralis CBS 781.70 TaxID=1392243 RepID=A0A6G1G071_9PEZI|nr:uncharacterized protein P152DRAFT_450212 [Eremomyces bilateralis CBS 781.70]KAF1811505.1 hypothetical protein P152DRAFT_450212 [Eremomyces bilateralis CBS 781.70]